MLDECYDAPERSLHPVFVALHETIVACDLPRQLFADLLHAFRMDQVKTDLRHLGRAPRILPLLRQSRRPPRPLGLRLPRREISHSSPTRSAPPSNSPTSGRTSSKTPSRGRRYLPAEYMRHFNVDEGQIAGRVFTPEFRAMMQDLVARTRTMLREGGTISAHVDRELAVTLDLFRKGGEAILDGIAAAGLRRPAWPPRSHQSKEAHALLARRTLRAKLGFTRRSNVTISRSLSCECRRHRQTRGQELLLCLPRSSAAQERRHVRRLRLHAPRRRHRRRRIHAHRSPPHRHVLLARRLARRSTTGGATDDPVFIALRDTQQRF